MGVGADFVRDGIRRDAERFAGMARSCRNGGHEKALPRQGFHTAQTDQRTLITGVHRRSSSVAWALRAFWLPLGLWRT